MSEVGGNLVGLNPSLIGSVINSGWLVSKLNCVGELHGVGEHPTYLVSEVLPV